MRSKSEAVIVTIVVLIFVGVALYLTGITAHTYGKQEGYEEGYATGVADTENKLWMSCQLQGYSCPGVLKKTR